MTAMIGFDDLGFTRVAPKVTRNMPSKYDSLLDYVTGKLVGLDAYPSEWLRLGMADEDAARKAAARVRLERHPGLKLQAKTDGKVLLVRAVADQAKAEQVAA